MEGHHDRSCKPPIQCERFARASSRRQGFRAVRDSLAAMNQSITTNPIKLMVSRAVLRTIDRVPLLKRRMADALGND